MTIGERNTLIEHLPLAYPPRALLYAGMAILSKGQRNERYGSKGYYNMSDSVLWFRSKTNREKYHNFLLRHNIPLSVYDMNVIKGEDMVEEMQTKGRLDSWNKFSTPM